MQAVLLDFAAVFTRWHTWLLMSMQDISMRYRRSAIGPFWISLSMAAMVLGMGLLYAQIFGVPTNEYVPYLGAGIMGWAFISSSVSDGCSTLIDSEGHLRSLPIPISVFAARTVSRNLIVLMHHVPVILLLNTLMFQAPLTTNLLWLIPGVLSIALIFFFFSLLLGPLCLRFRDINQVISSLMQMAMFLTPVFWMPGQGRASVLVAEVNPFYHLLQLIRAPMLGQEPSPLNWAVAAGLAVACFATSLFVLGDAKKKLFLWL